MKNHIKLFFVALICLFSGCVSLTNIEKADISEGISKSFKADYDTVKAAALASVQSLNINIKKTEEKDGLYQILFTKSISAFSWGEVGRVTVKASGSENSTVIVHSGKRYKPQITGIDESEFANSIFAGIQEALESKE